MAGLVKMEYRGIQVSFTEKGWFNATASAKRFGKTPNDWMRLPDTVAYLAALESRYGKIPYVKTSRARADRGGGTWLHPKLAVRFTQWLDVDFAIWCDEQIDKILRHEPIGNSDEDDERSTVKDRLLLYHAAIDIMVAYRLPLGRIYQAMNWYAGVKRMRKMSKAQAVEVVSFGVRLLSGKVTPDDFERIDTNRCALTGDSRQLDLIGLKVHLSRDKE